MAKNKNGWDILSAVLEFDETWAWVV